MLNPFDENNRRTRDASGGFQVRDVIRFFAVDLILIITLKLLLGLGFFPTADIYVLATLGGKVALLAYLAWLIRDRRGAWPETGAASAGRWWGWPLAIAVYAAFYPLMLYVDQINLAMLTRLYGLIGWHYVPAAQDVMVLLFEDILHPANRVLLLLFTLAIGPFMEELAFRGMGMDAFRRADGPVAAVFWTSFLFGLYHFSLQVLLPLSVLAALLAAIRLFSRSLWPAICIHCLHNTLALAITARNLGVIELW